MVSKLVKLLLIPTLGIIILIPGIIFADSTGIEAPSTTVSGSPASSPTTTPFQSYSQKQHSLFNSNLDLSTGASTSGALQKVLSPINGLLNNIIQAMKGFNYSKFSLPGTQGAATDTSGTTNTQPSPSSGSSGYDIQKILETVQTLKKDAAAQQGTLATIKTVFLFIAQLTLTTLDVISQIIKGLISWIK